MSQHDLALAQESCRGHGTFSPLLTANVFITCHETFNSMYYYSIAMSLGNWFCMSIKGGTGEGELAGCENLSVGPFFLFKCNGDLENSHFAGSPCSVQGQFHLPKQLTVNVLGQLTAVLCAVWSRKVIPHCSRLVFIVPIMGSWSW